MCKCEQKLCKKRTSCRRFILIKYNRLLFIGEFRTITEIFPCCQCFYTQEKLIWHNGNFQLSCRQNRTFDLTAFVIKFCSEKKTSRAKHAQPVINVTFAVPWNERSDFMNKAVVNRSRIRVKRNWSTDLLICGIC